MSRDSEPHRWDSYRLLTTAARLIQRRQDNALAPLGLTRAAVIALEGIAPHPLNQEQLAAKVQVQSQTLGRVLARLEGEGLVTRTRSLADRRQFEVKLTPAGKAALAAARKAERDALPPDIDLPGWETLHGQLARFVAALQTSPRSSALRPVRPGSHRPLMTPESSGAKTVPSDGAAGHVAPGLPHRAGAPTDASGEKARISQPPEQPAGALGPSAVQRESRTYRPDSQ